MNEPQELIEILNDPESEIDWDDAWVRLMANEDGSPDAIASFLKALGGETEFVRIAAIRKLRNLKVPGHLWKSDLCRLLADPDSGVRAEALDAAKDMLGTSEEIAEAIEQMRSRLNEYVGLRLKTWWYLWRSGLN